MTRLKSPSTSQSVMPHREPGTQQGDGLSGCGRKGGHRTVADTFGARQYWSAVIEAVLLERSSVVAWFRHSLGQRDGTTDCSPGRRGLTNRRVQANTAAENLNSAAGNRQQGFAVRCVRKVGINRIGPGDFTSQTLSRGTGIGGK